MWALNHIGKKYQVGHDYFQYLGLSRRKSKNTYHSGDFLSLGSSSYDQAMKVVVQGGFGETSDIQDQYDNVPSGKAKSKHAFMRLPQDNGNRGGRWAPCNIVNTEIKNH